MNGVSINDVAELLVPIFNVFSPHVLMIFSMMCAFAIGKFVKDIMV